MQISSTTASPLPTSPPARAPGPQALDPTAIEPGLRTPEVEVDRDSHGHDGLTHRETKALLRDGVHAARRSLHAYAREQQAEDPHAMRDTQHALRDFRHEVRGAERDLHHGELDGTEFLARVGGAFEGLASALGVSEAAGDEAPSSDAVGETLPTDSVAEDPGTALREVMQALRERFDAVVGRLEDLLGVAGEPEVPPSEVAGAVAHYEELDAETPAETTGVRVDVQV